MANRRSYLATDFTTLGAPVSIVCIALALFAFSFSAAAHAQLGPKDGAGLPRTDLERVKVGQPAPDFTLENLDRKPVALSDFRGKKNVLLVFYRGQW